jgi:hypothetical protein
VVSTIIAVNSLRRSALSLETEISPQKTLQKLRATQVDDTFEGQIWQHWQQRVPHAEVRIKSTHDKEATSVGLWEGNRCLEEKIFDVCDIQAISAAAEYQSELQSQVEELNQKAWDSLRHPLIAKIEKQASARELQGLLGSSETVDA